MGALEKHMTKNGSNGRKARIRARATEAGLSHRQAAREVDAQRAREEGAHEAGKARMRAALHNSEDLAEERTLYLRDMLAADLPDSVRVCLFALADRLGTGKPIDTRGISFTHSELATQAGLSLRAVEESLNLARAHGWITGDFTGGHVRLTVPGEDVGMYEWFLKQVKQPVRDTERHSSVLARINQELNQQAQRAEEARVMIKEFMAARTTANAS